MRQRISIAVIALLFMNFLYAAGHTTSRVFPLSKTKFVYKQKNGVEKTVDLTGQDFIVASLREKGADGIAYAVDRDGVVWWASPISSGAKGHETPSCVFSIFRKERFYMSKSHPDAEGVNNMDFSLWFTHQGHAIHMGNDDGMSHGCIHVGSKGAATMFKWAKKGTKVVVTREHYLPFVYYDLLQSGYKESKVKKAHIKEYLKKMKPIPPHM
jgi:lipoprotein-anchoring transpeptidase ErfK/SrfK